MVEIESGGGEVPRPARSLGHESGQSISTGSSPELQVTNIEHPAADALASDELRKDERPPDEAPDIPMTVAEEPQQDRWASLPCRDHPA